MAGTGPQVAASATTPDAGEGGVFGTWTSKAPLPVAIAEVGVGQLGGRVYVIGGTAQAGVGAPTAASQFNLAYDPSTDSWEERAPLPHALSHVGVTSLDGTLYAIGGITDNVHMGPRDSTLAYDPATDQWSELPPFSTPRGSLGVVAVDGRVHILGGLNAQEVEKISPPGGPELSVGIGTARTHEVYDAASGTWTEASPLPGPARGHMGVAALDGNIHVFGGRINDYTDMLDRHDVYDPMADTWLVAAPLPRPRSAGAFTVLEGLVIYAGGECKPGGGLFTPNAFEDVTAYDADTDTWQVLTSLPQGRHAFGAATVDGVAYFAGGALLCGGGTSTDLLALTL